MRPDDPWVGGYVRYEWEHGRHIFESYMGSLVGKRVLEFGSNVGGSAVVLAMLGAEVTGVDVSVAYCEIARMHAHVYGMAGRVTILNSDDTRSMPLDSGKFDLIVCNSVLEYVHHDQLAAVQAELMRVLAPGGVLLVLGTSSRLAPKEVHSGRWLVNYLPRWMERLTGMRELQRGVSPFAVRRNFSGLEVLDLADGAQRYLESKRRMGASLSRLRMLRAIHGASALLGTSVGMLMPSFAIAFMKRQNR